jgi:hypothetical protein
MPSERRLLDGKPTFHSQSASGDVDHLKITGGVGIFPKESAAVASVNTPLLAGNPAQLPGSRLPGPEPAAQTAQVASHAIVNPSAPPWGFSVTRQSNISP